MVSQKERAKFGAEELATALSHFDIGIIHEIEEFPRGSRRAPKVLIRSERGSYLFKRRAKGKDDLPKVAFTHQIQLSLASQNFPLPHLIGTRDDNNSLLVLEHYIYELFDFIHGGAYDHSPDATFNAGRILGLYHKLLAGFQSDYQPPAGSYHNAPPIQKAIRRTVDALPSDGRPTATEVTSTVEAIEEAYARCAKQSIDLGLPEWPAQIVHGDWHPGNMLFADRHVVAVIDYDAARLQQRVIDLANGALQFSIQGGSENPTQWPEQVDETRFQRFMRGYDKVNVISKLELRALPYLMCEAMIAEAVLPIAATGHFGRIAGFPFLQMVRKKVAWILEHVDRLYEVVEEG
jgi:Ser/Thr protein kinase RdoA (MazF antagonist)